MTHNDRGRKLLVRSALATSVTIATFIGAQNLAMLDASQLSLTLTPTSSATVTSDAASVTSPASQSSVPPAQHAAPQLVIRHAAPSIVILRQSGQNAASGTASSPNTTTQAVSAQAVQSPPPSQITLPNPVVVQQPIVQTGQSSR
jgi:hypothetical protein